MDLSSSLHLAIIIVNIVHLQLGCGEIQGAPSPCRQVNKIAMLMGAQIKIMTKNKITEAKARSPVNQGQRKN